MSMGQLQMQNNFNQQMNSNYEMLANGSGYFQNGYNDYFEGGSMGNMGNSKNNSFNMGSSKNFGSVNSLNNLNSMNSNVFTYKNAK